VLGRSLKGERGGGDMNGMAAPSNKIGGKIHILHLKNERIVEPNRGKFNKRL
jgi:hypothetical protein